MTEVWVTYLWDWGYHVSGIFASAEDAAKETEGYLRVAKVPFGADVPAALDAWERRPK